MSAVFGREPSRPLPDQEDEPIEAVVVEERGPDDEPLIDLREDDEADLDEQPDADVEPDAEPVSSTADPDPEPEFSTADPEPEPEPAADLDPEPEPEPAADLDPTRAGAGRTRARAGAGRGPRSRARAGAGRGPRSRAGAGRGPRSRAVQPRPGAGGRRCLPGAGLVAGWLAVGGPVALTDESAGRWDELQVRFVDDPRGAVDGAAGLLAEALAAMAPGDASTEDLRLAFQRYRAAFRDLRPA